MLQRQVETRLIALTEQLAPPRGDALEVGCAGTAALGYLERSHDQVVGIDLSLGQVARAAPVATSATLIQADITTYRLPPASYDLIFSSMTLHWVDALDVTVARLMRALKPGGVLAYSLPLQRSLHALRRYLDERYGYQPFNSFPTLTYARAGLGFVASAVVVQSQTYHEQYPTMQQLFKHFQTIGANTLTTPHQSL